MRNKSHGLEEGDILSYNDYLDKINGENSEDTAPTLIPVLLGDGNVEMKSYTAVLQDNKQLLEAQDFSDNIGVINTEHRYIHLGQHYFDSRVLQIPANTTFEWVVEVGAKRPHLTFELNPTNGGLFFETYGDIVSNEDGTPIIPRNNNELSTNVSTVLFRLNPTGVVSTGGYFIRNGRIGTVGGTAQRAGGNFSRGNEIILANNRKYLLRLQNLNNETLYVNLTHSWYENELPS